MEIKLNRSGFTGAYIIPSKTMLPKVLSALARIPNIHNLEVWIDGAGKWRSLRVYEPGPNIGNGAEHKFYFMSTTIHGTPTQAWQSIVEQIEIQFS